MSDAGGPPTLPRRPVVHVTHGRRRVDPWAWVRDRDDPEILRHLEAENAWTEAALGRWSDLRATILAELKSRIVPDTSSPPVRDGPFLYYSSYRKGHEYPVFRRRSPEPGSRSAAILDQNALAREAHPPDGDGYFHVGAAEPSPDHRLLAFACDTVGRRTYAIRFRDMKTGRFLPDVIPAAAPNIAWAETGDAILYAALDPDTLRWRQIMRHVLGTPSSADTLAYFEEDEEFSVSVEASRSRDFLLIHAVQTERTEALAIPSRDSAAAPRVLLRREAKHEFELDHFHGRFVIRTNRDAPDFRLASAPEDAPEAGWRDIVPARDGVHLEGFELFETHVALFERENGRQELRLLEWDSGSSRAVALPGPVRALDPEENPEPDASEVRIVVSTPRAPPTTFAVDLATGAKRTLKRERVPGFRSRAYRTRRLFVEAPDGARVPVSLAYRADHPPSPESPLLLYGYGAYGVSMDPYFSGARVSLLDRGFTFAIAHVRGGQEMGRAWYDAGRLERKTNTFTDFLAVGRALRDRGLADPGRMFAMGGSAGGLLVGAAMNMDPGLFRGVVAMVPFVDVVNTMLDATIPLTTGEYDEWGDPNDPRWYRIMDSYAPYENVRPARYPHVLATGGLHDSQVQFWEPTKWVLRLRENQKDEDALVLLHANLDAGHGGRSGRYRGLDETAMIHAFLVGLAGASSGKEHPTEGGGPPSKEPAVSRKRSAGPAGVPGSGSGARRR